MRFWFPMPLRIYNSLTKKKEEFVPLDPKGKTVKMYTCGVTVYDQCHIGHARSLYVFDVIRRYFKFCGYDLRFIRNITDVDDKIINKAIELKKTSQQVADENIASYYRDMESLGIERADKEPKATDNVSDMVKNIKGLIINGAAYAIDGDVYFSVRKFPEYGKLSGQSIEEMQEAVRIDKDAKKKDPLDFALWKKSKEGEPSWPSPWGAGRPGWHIECSCMSLKHLNCETLDIHAGGRDLIFPHHENEIAQAEALTHKPFAKYWIHHGLLTINAQKMAKSLDNFITVENILKKYTVDELKMFFLFSHYASAIDYNDDKMQEARKALQRFDTLFWKAFELTRVKEDVASYEAAFISEHKERFMEAMDDDFNTPRALACLFDLLSDTNKFIDEAEGKDPNYFGVIYAAVETLEELSRNVFGLFLKEKEVQLSDEEKNLVEERRQARLNKNFKRSDELREALKRMGVSIEDTKTGQTWRRI